MEPLWSNKCLLHWEHAPRKLLLRFCMHQVVLTADIVKSFLMVLMSEKFWDVLQFLWVAKNQPEIHVMRFAQFVFGVFSSPFLLNATVRHHLREYFSSHSEFVKSLSQSIYVDDTVSGAENEDYPYQLHAESKDMLRSGGFTLQKFITNSTHL